MTVTNMKAESRRLDEDPYIGKVLVHFCEGLGRHLPCLPDFRLSYLVFSIIILISFSIFAGNPGSLLYVTENSCYARGTMVLMNCTTGETDTLVRGVVYAPTFSPDGSRIAYCLPENDKNIYVCDVFGGQTKVLYKFSNGDTNLDISWPQKDYIFWPSGYSGVCLMRLHIPTGTIDTVHKLTTNDDCYHCMGKPYTVMTQGGVSADCRHAAFMLAGDCDNKVVSFEIGGKEELISGGCGNSCQASISPDGRLVAASHYTHAWAWVKYFNNKDSIYRELWPPLNRGWWMFRFSRNSSDHVLFSPHIEDPNKKIYLWRLGENRYYPLVDGCGWDFYAGVWVQDTLPANAPGNLHTTATPTAHKIVLSWDAPIVAVDNDLPQEYVIYRNGVKIAAVEQTGFTDNDLAEGAAYHYQVYSKDDGMRLSNPLEGTFSTAVDHEAPVLLSAECVGDCTQVVLRFDEQLESVSAQTTGNYLFNPAAAVGGAALTESHSVTLKVSPLTVVQPYALTLSGVKDVSTQVNSLASQVKGLFLITNTTSTTGNKYSWDILETDKMFYTDNSIAIGPIPSRLAGSYYLKTAFADNAETGSSLVSFDCNTELRVYIFRGRYDLADPEPLPSWMNGFEATKDTIFGRWWFAGYKKTFPAGRITLGGSGCTDDLMGNYIAVVQPTDSTLTSTWATIDEQSHNEPLQVSAGVYAFPNPFSSATLVKFSVPQAKNGDKQKVSVRIYDLNGKLVQTLAQGMFAAGYHTAAFNGRENGNGQTLGNGIYFCRMQAPGYSRTLKLLLVQ